MDNHNVGGWERTVSRLLHEIERNEVEATKINGAIADIEMIQALQADAFGSNAFSIALDCMRIQWDRLMVDARKMRALHDSPVPERDEVKEALLRQRRDVSGYDVVADAASVIGEA